MNFTVQIKEAMIMLQEACKLNENWKDCIYCPFGEYCDAIEEADCFLPCDDDFVPQ